eukprot:scaffold2279_cov70-Skeletonema_menzelii.AAC.1
MSTCLAQLIEVQGKSTIPSHQFNFFTACIGSGRRRELPFVAGWRKVNGMEPAIASTTSTMKSAVLGSFSSFRMSRSACFDWYNNN